MLPIATPCLRRFLLAGAGLAALAGPGFAQSSLLPDTVVSASREPLPASRVGSAVTVITRSDIEARQALTAADLLRDVPGVTLGRSGSFGGQTDVRIRGAESNHTLVLIDGIKVNDPSLSQTFDFSQITANEIERIEVLRGPQSSIYGSEAVGGVINIVTRSGRRGFNFDAFTEAGSFRTLAGGFNVRYGDDLIKAALGYTTFQTHGISTADRRSGNPESDPFRLDTWHGKVSVTPADFIEFRLAGRSSKSLGHIDTFQDGFLFPCMANNLCLATDDRSFYKFVQYFGRGDVILKFFEGNLTNRTGLSYSMTQNDSLAASYNSVFTNKSRRRKVDNETTLKFSTPEVARADHRFTFLFEHERTSVLSASDFGFFERAITSKSYVGEYALGLWDRLFLTGAIRFDDNDFFTDRTTYRVTGAYLFKEYGARLHASAGTGVKNPDLYQLFGSSPGFTPNPSLRPQRSFGWDVGVEKTFADQRVTLDVTYFQNRIQDRIVATQQTVFNVTGTSEIQGIEFAAKWRPLAGLELGGSYTWTDARDATGQSPVRRPRHVGSLFATYSFLDDKAKVHVNARFIGPQRDTVFFFDAMTFASSTAATDLKGYVLLNVAASYKLHENVEIYGRIENALNQKYQEVFSFGTPGIGAFAGLRVRFDGQPW